MDVHPASVRADPDQGNLATSLPVHAAVPGILAVLLNTLVFYTSAGAVPDEISSAYLILLAVLPWMVIIVARRRPISLGFTGRGITSNWFWGALLGIFWRAGTLLFNFAVLRLSAFHDARWVGFETILLIPWMEEVFFRGYLGNTLGARFGRGWGNLLQAVLFSCQPAHLTQGSLGVGQIFLFGLAAGWVAQRKGSIWAAFSAHAAANAMAILLPRWI